ncbi:MAG: PCMD domain-containing protein, partial [Bacteroidia bacterium]|nr:PCMD domain-containing protein [Bacteroidia bacterium]
EKNIIAYCELKTAENTNGYKQFNMEFKYKDTDRKPKYIVLVAASSRYGDYFTGSTSSVLYVDEFELVY